MNKVMFLLLGTCLVLCLFSASVFAEDIEIKIVRITYLDDRTSPNNPEQRELKEFTHGKDYWSAPDVIDVDIEVKNSKNEKARFRLSSSLYFLLKQRDGVLFPEMTGEYLELRSISKEPVWVWNRSFGGTRYHTLQPNESTILTIKKMNIKNLFHPKNYSIMAFAIRIFAQTKKKDDNLMNNVAERIFNYPM